MHGRAGRWRGCVHARIGSGIGYGGSRRAGRGGGEVGAGGW